MAVDSWHVYWASRGTDTTGRANMDGTGANQGFISGAFLSAGVAFGAG